jgi:oligoendopeptidase F
MNSLQRLSGKKAPIHINPEHAGRLRAKTHTAAGKKIPLATLEAKKNSTDPATRKQANFALVARSWHHGG